MANKLISQLSGAAANLQDVDVIEGQKNGAGVTVKYTGLQARAVEKGERENQDNVIEAGVGLNANGTFTPPANSWGLRVADFAAGCVDRSGATGALTQNVINGLRLLDARVYELGNGSLVVAYLGVNSDTTYSNVIPAGYMLEYVVFEEKAAASPILDLGTSAGGNQVFINQPLTTSGLTTIVIERVFSLTGNTTLYLNDDDTGSSWDGATVDLYFVLKPITAGGVLKISGSINVPYYSGSFGWAVPPTQLEITAVIGTASDFDAGTTFYINDTDYPHIWLVTTDNTQWFVSSSVLQLAL